MGCFYTETILRAIQKVMRSACLLDILHFFCKKINFILPVREIYVRLYCFWSLDIKDNAAVCLSSYQETILNLNYMRNVEN